MNNEYLPAQSVCLYASNSIISLTSTDNAYLHGCENLELPSLAVDGITLANIAKALNIKIHPITIQRYAYNIEDIDLPLFIKKFTHVSGSIEELMIAESGQGGLRIKITERVDDDSFVTHMSYFGPYSIFWAKP